MPENETTDSVSEQNTETEQMPDPAPEPRAARTSVIMKPRPQSGHSRSTKESSSQGKSGTSKDDTVRPSGFDPAKAGVRRRGSVFLFFGVILPTLAMSFELLFHFCAANYFDPFPSPAHVVLFALIPFSNFLTWLATRRDLSQHLGFMSLASGMAVGVGVLYTLMFLPLTPSACLWVMALGFGLLGLAPLLSLPCSFLAGKAVCDIAHRKTTYFNAHQMEHIGHLIILVMVVAVELPSTLTRVNIARAAESDTAQSGIDWLRKYGSREVMLRACYERSGRATDILGSLYESNHPIKVEKAREIFFLVTGQPYNAVAIPAGARATLKHIQMAKGALDFNAGVNDEFDIDMDVAGENVGSVARGLSTSASTMKVDADGDAAIAKIDWKLTFKNESKIDREARAKILLPAGAVVEKAYITIDGVEKQATIKGASLARAIYQQAAVERKDPLLVSSCGKDMVLVQCYPVSANSELTVRMVIASPLQIQSTADKATLTLPAFEEKNFQSERTKLELLPSSASAQVSTTVPVDKEQTVATKDIDSFGEILTFSRNPAIKSAFYKLSENNYLVRAIQKTTYPGARELFVVVDGSQSMTPYLSQVADGLGQLPPEIDLHITEVIDQERDLTPTGISPKSPDWQRTLDGLKNSKPIGGQDDSLSLMHAVSQAAHSNGSVLWIHGPQPLDSGLNSTLQAMLAQVNSTYLYDLEVTAGTDQIAGKISSPKLIRAPHTGTVAGDIQNLLQNLRSGNTTSGDSPTGMSKFLLASAMPTDSDAAPEEIKALYGLEQFELNQAVNPPLAQGAALGAGIVSPLTSLIVTDDKSHFTPRDTRDKFTAIVEDSWYAFDNANSAIWGSLSGFTQNSVETKCKEMFDYQVNQLNSLSSAAGSQTGAPGYYLPQKSANIPASGLVPPPPAYNSAPSSPQPGQAAGSGGYISDYRDQAKQRLDDDSYGMAVSNLRQSDEKKPLSIGAAPILQGATDGTIAPMDANEALKVGKKEIGSVQEEPVAKDGSRANFAPQRELRFKGGKLNTLASEQKLDPEWRFEGATIDKLMTHYTQTRAREEQTQEARPMPAPLSPAQEGIFKILSTLTLFIVLPLGLIVLWRRKK